MQDEQTQNSLGTAKYARTMENEGKREREKERERR